MEQPQTGLMAGMKSGRKRGKLDAILYLGYNERYEVSPGLLNSHIEKLWRYTASYNMILLLCANGLYTWIRLNYVGRYTENCRQK